MIAGIDEAGRGPVFGPLVVAGVAIADDAPLRELGCRDSKRLSPRRRERLARLVQDLPGVRVEVRVITPQQLDGERTQHSLNAIELARFLDIASALGADTTYVDAVDTDAERFGAAISPHLRAGCRVVSEHGADDRHVVVGAASIIAKVARDEAIAELARRLEPRINMPLGSGYPSDPATKAFLAAWVETHGELPEGVRRSWATVREMVGPKRTRLADFR